MKCISEQVECSKFGPSLEHYVHFQVLRLHFHNLKKNRKKYILVQYAMLGGNAISWYFKADLSSLQPYLVDWHWLTQTKELSPIRV